MKLLLLLLILSISCGGRDKSKDDDPILEPDQPKPVVIVTPSPEPTPKPEKNIESFYFDMTRVQPGFYVGDEFDPKSNISIQENGDWVIWSTRGMFSPSNIEYLSYSASGNHLSVDCGKFFYFIKNSN